MVRGLRYPKRRRTKERACARNRYWWPAKIVDTLYRLDFPNSLHGDECELRQIVYDIATLNPTVESEVWEPEGVLVRFSPAEIR